MTAKHASLGDRLTKAIRVRGDAARQAYHVARRAGGLLRDRPRRTALRELPPTLFDIVKSDGFLVLPPGSFPETPAVVAELLGWQLPGLAPCLLSPAPDLLKIDF